jgi:hypothetical protein
MNQMKCVVQLQQRFRRAQKKIAAESKIPEEVIDDLCFGSSVEIDQDVTAKNQIHALHEQHLRVFR